MNADYYATVTKPYEGPWQYKETNKFFLRNSDALLIVYDENKRFPMFMKQLADEYAQSHEYQIFVIDAYDLEAIVQEEMYEQW